jgi:nucleotide-binding universal stress UspA family protein
VKVLFATEGSSEDDQARDFVAAARWPAGTEIELFGVVLPAGLAILGDLVDRNVRDCERELDRIAGGLPRPASTVTWRCVVGEPASAIVDRARTFEADLIVVGTRGRGRIASSILGSVSAGVIDRTPCPVLVARGAKADRIVLADDGSVGAATAAALLRTWPIFAEAALQVVAVVDVGRPLSAPADAPMIYPADERLFIESLVDECDGAHRIVAACARSMKPRPRTITTSVLVGDAGDEILAAASGFAADLIVVGSRGQTGLARFFAGSVARQILFGAKCSVLIARGCTQLVRESGQTHQRSMSAGTTARLMPSGG